MAVGRHACMGRRSALLAASGLFVCLLLISAAPAEAVTRLRVEWNAPSQYEFSPAVRASVAGGSSGDYSGPCQQPGNCRTPGSGFRWEEANPNAGGYYQTISLVDDQPGQGRRICFSVRHPYAADFPTDPRFQINVTVTDTNGATRTQSYSLAKGQTSEVDCSPVFRPPPGLGTVRPPSWWLQGRRLISRRGGKCRSSTSQIEARDPRTGDPGGTYTETAVQCRHVILKRLGVKWGGNPAARTLAEGCSSIISRGNPEGDGYVFSCRIFSTRSGSRNPTMSSWPCERSKGLDLRDGDRRSDRAWTARRTPRSRKRQAGTLARCLARRPKR